jgi:heme oxygenase (biliverdin-IX-beta and delta-forming)
VITVAQELKQNTRHLHRGVEAHLKLFDPSISSERLTSIVLRFYGFWAVNEPAIERWCVTNPQAASALRWGRRQRTALFADDLLRVGITQRSHRSVPRPTPVFEHIGQAEVLGWLYVVEGSTLGGAIIDRHVRNTPALATVSVRCFVPYAEGPEDMWLAFRSSLQDFTSGDPSRTAAVVSAAVATFESLDRWLSPLDIDCTG